MRQQTLGVSPWRIRLGETFDAGVRSWSSGGADVFGRPTPGLKAASMLILVVSGSVRRGAPSWS
jgi:hypothetical protein